MRLATIVEDGRAIGRGRGRRRVPAVPLTVGDWAPFASRDRGGRSDVGLDRIADVGGRPAGRGVRRPLDERRPSVPAVPDPGAIYTIGLNYRRPASPDAARPPRPLVYGKAADLRRRRTAPSLTLGSFADRQRRRRVRARASSSARPRRRAARRWPRLRLHDRQRRLVARRVARRRPVAARQVDGRASARSARGSSRATSSIRPTCGSAARVNGVADPGRPHDARCASRSPRSSRT